MFNVTSTTVFVGLDYHTESVQVCVLARDGKILKNRSCRNDWRAIATVVRQGGGPEVRVQAAIESCCGAAALADELVAQANWSVDLAHPGYVARIKQSPDKTDFSDAHLLADLERVGYLPRVWLAPEEVREQRRLIRYRQTLAKERKNLKLQISGALREARQKPPVKVNAWTKAWLNWLTNAAVLSPNARLITRLRLVRLTALATEIREVERFLAEQTAEDRLVQKLRTHSGIGPVTAANHCANTISSPIQPNGCARTSSWRGMPVMQIPHKCTPSKNRALREIIDGSGFILDVKSPLLVALQNVQHFLKCSSCLERAMNCTEVHQFLYTSDLAEHPDRNEAGRNEIA